MNPEKGVERLVLATSLIYILQRGIPKRELKDHCKPRRRQELAQNPEKGVERKTEELLCSSHSRHRNPEKGVERC